MNKIEKLAQTKFDGNVEEAIKYMQENFTAEAKHLFIKEFTPEQRKFFVGLCDKNVEKKYGSFDNFFKETVIETELDITEEDIKKSEKNPYLSKLGKNLLKILLANAAIVVTTLYSQSPTLTNILPITMSGVSAAVSYDLASNLTHYFQFNKLKKKLNSEEYQKSMKEFNEWKNKKKLDVEDIFDESENLKL